MVADKDKTYLKTLLYLIGVILFWRGIWDLTYEYPIIELPIVSLFLGLAILTLTGYIFHEAGFLSPKSQKFEALNNMLDGIKGKKGYSIQFYDQLTDAHEHINPQNIQKIENDVLVVKKGKHEHFFPIQRISYVKKGKKTLWKK